MAFKCKLCDEIHVGSDHLNEYCDQCKSEINDEDNQDFFEPCYGCDLQDACLDFGCAEETGIKERTTSGVF